MLSSLILWGGFSVWKKCFIFVIIFHCFVEDEDMFYFNLIYNLISIKLI